MADFSPGVKPGEAIILTDATPEEVAAKISDSLPVKGAPEALDTALEAIHSSGLVFNLGCWRSKFLVRSVRSILRKGFRIIMHLNESVIEILLGWE